MTLLVVACRGGFRVVIEYRPEREEDYFKFEREESPYSL